MIEIAKKLNAKVQGDDCEVYELSESGKIIIKDIEGESINSDLNKRKPWWKIW